jgi:uncharacterized membrane protein YbaN (DUF454 family)
VSPTGNDSNDGLSTDEPFATLAQTAAVINGITPLNGNYLVIVMDNLISTACARYYNNNVTITSIDGEQFTVIRGAGFAALSDTARSWYNPPMLEIESVDLTPTASRISLTLTNIIFDDAYLTEGTIFDYAPTWNGVSPPTAPTGWGSMDCVQDAIVASYAHCATIILEKGSELQSFGGMTAARAADGATIIMKNGSLITDVDSTNATRQISTTLTDYRAVGETAVSISTNSHFYMYYGAVISNIANAHSVKLSGNYKCFIDGEITGMKGNRGWDATDRSTNPKHEGRGPKCAVFFAGGTTLNTGEDYPGDHAIIGPNANIHYNQVKCGAIGVSRSTGISVKIYGKINDNSGQTGTTWRNVPIIGEQAISSGTNGGGIYIVLGGTVYLEDGSELCRNSVMNNAYGGAASVQQSGSKLVMNGGLVSGNTAAGMGPGIAVNKNGAVFEMNGGVIDNTANGVLLFNNSVLSVTDTDCNSHIVLNAGTVSGVTVHSNVAHGYSAQRYLNLSKNVKSTATNGRISVAGRNVVPITADFKIGNPNTATYPTTTTLPQGWTIPSNVNNVIGFWMQKDGIAAFSVPAPTGSASNNYNSGLGVYIAAVQATKADGTADTSVPIKFYPTTISESNIIVSVPLNGYPNGATVVLVQPTTTYGQIIFAEPYELLYDISATDYTVHYTGSYDMPSGFIAALDTAGHDNTNTVFTFTIRPDTRTEPDNSTLILNSDIFEITNSFWDTSTHELIIDLKLTNTWKNPETFDTTFEFDCIMDAAHFVEDDFLELSGDITIVGLSKTYFIYSNIMETEMVVLKGNLKISKNVSGDAADPAKDFHFIVRFAPDGTYGGVASGSQIVLQAGGSEDIRDIPRGIEYMVVEVEANQDGYTTTSTGASGTISETLSEAVFLNTKNTIAVEDFRVYYNGNGESGGVVPVDGGSPYVEGSQVVVLGQGSLVRAGYSFIGWSTSSTAVIATFTAGSTFYIWSDTVLFAVWTAPVVVDTYTVTYEPSVHGTFSAVSYVGLAYGDATPAAPTITGETGWNFTGWAPACAVIVTANVTYVAQWTQVSTVTPTPSAAPSLTPSPSAAPTISPSIVPTVTPTETPKPTPTSIMEDHGPPVWALVNLVLSVVGVILAILAVVFVLLQQRQKQKAKQKYEQRNVKNQNAAKSTDKQDDNEMQQMQHRKMWLIITVAMGIVGIIVFLLTQNMKLPMAMVDKWTIVNAIIFIVEIIAIAFIFKRKEAEQTQNNSTTSNSNA